MLGAVTQEEASGPIAGAPYTVLPNVAHAQMWHCYWLSLNDSRATEPEDDWPSPQSNDWDVIRSQCIDGLTHAQTLSNANLDPETETRLLRIVLHGAHHSGQIQMLRRMLTEG